MHIYKCTNERTKTKQIILKYETQKKKNTTTRDKNMTILIGMLRFGKTTTQIGSASCRERV